MLGASLRVAIAWKPGYEKDVVGNVAVLDLILIQLIELGIAQFLLFQRERAGHGPQQAVKIRHRSCLFV